MLFPVQDAVRGTKNHCYGNGGIDPVQMIDQAAQQIVDTACFITIRSKDFGTTRKIVKL